MPPNLQQPSEGAGEKAAARVFFQKSIQPLLLLRREQMPTVEGGDKVELGLIDRTAAIGYVGLQVIHEHEEVIRLRHPLRKEHHP